MPDPAPPKIAAPTPAMRALAGVVRTSRINGWSVAVLGGCGLLVSLVIGDAIGAGVSLMAVLSGAMEIRGNRLLRRAELAGMKWLVRSQLLLLGTVLAYCAGRITAFDAEYLKTTAILDAREQLSALGISLDDFLAQGGLTVDELLPLVRKAFLGFYTTVILLTLLYQGGLAMYYRRKGKLVAGALQQAV